jgi:cytochrome c553
MARHPAAIRLHHMQTPTRPTLLLLAVLVTSVCSAQSTTALSLLQKAMALTPDPESGELLYIQQCSACHRRSGWGNGPREIPTLAGQQDVYLLEQLIHYSVQDRKKDEMHEVVTKSEIARPQALRDISAYVARRPRDPSPERGDGTQLLAGERLYAQSCAICHGKMGEGNAEDLIPAIGGQQYRYLLRRLQHFAQDHGAQQHSDGVEPAVINLLSRLSPSEIKAIADYTSRLAALRGP